MKFMIMPLLGLTLAGVAQAQDRAGNGGDAVVCPERVYMLDTRQVEKKDKAVTFKEGSSVRQMVYEGIARIEDKDGKLASEVRDRAEVFLKDIIAYEDSKVKWQENTEFTTDELVNVPDEGSASVPQGCVIKQLIIHHPKPLPGEKKYQVQVDLWEDMTDKEKAVAVLHEAIYGYLMTFKAMDSATARFYNGLVITNSLVEYSDQAYYQLLRDIKFPETVVQSHGVSFDTSHASFDNLGNLSSIYSGYSAKQILKDATFVLFNIKVGRFNGKKTWLKAMVRHPVQRTFTEFRDLDTKEVFKNYVTPRESVNKNLYWLRNWDREWKKLENKNLVIFGQDETAERTDTGLKLSNVKSCEIKRPFLGEPVAECLPYAVILVDENGNYETNVKKGN